MWANAQRDGRPAEYRWRPVLNAAKFGSSPLLDCEDMWTRYCCLTFFTIADMCLSCEDIARQSYAMLPRWRFLAIFCVLHFQRAACSTFQTCILNLASLGHPCKFQRVSRLGSVTARHSSSGRQPKFAALNRGRHLYSAGRPSRWTLAHISSYGRPM